MRQQVINLFMWDYQPYFCDAVERLMDSVMTVLGVPDSGVECLLVGFKVPGAAVRHDVCVEPETGHWPLTLFSNLAHAVELHIRTHPMQDMHYGDEARMRDQPENIRRDSVRKAIQDALVPYDSEHRVHSFAGFPEVVNGYYVVAVLQIPAAIFERYRPLLEPVSDGRFTGHPSLIHAAASKVLEEACHALRGKDPGRFDDSIFASAEEIARRAATSFMYTPGIAVRDRSYGVPNLFERFNLISSLMYEGAEGKGRVLLTNLESGAVDVALALAEPVPFREPRWSRKVLQMASAETALLANCETILGLGNIAAGTVPWQTQNVFQIEFHDHYHWSLSCGEEVLLVSKYGAPSLPHDKFPKDRLVDTFQRLFPDVTPDDVATFAALYDAAVEQRHGSMLVVARDASEEANRLGGQGTKIKPTKLTPELYRRVSNIDGTIIIDPKGVCYAVGVILDGPANEDCTPARGARYNSGVRYVAASTEARMAIVVSDDGTVDVIPVLRPRIRRSVIEEHIKKLEASTVDSYFEPIGWLDKHRFYLDQSHCDRVNTEQARLDSVPREVGELRVFRELFKPDPGCTSDYFAPESTA